MDNTTADASGQGAQSDGTSRRRLMAGIAGAAVAALAARPASATTEPTEATTTTTLPKQPTPEDIPLLVGAQGLELAALELYAQALAADEAVIASGATEGLMFDDLTRTSLAALRLHHDAYAESYGGLLGRNSIRTADADLLAAQTAAFSSGDVATVLGAAHDLEKSLAATHIELAGQIMSVDAARLIASLTVVEARHIAVLAKLAGLDPVSDIAAFVDNDATPLTPADPA